MKLAWDVLVIGGGPAGLAAATAARTYDPNASVLIVERDVRLGGILNQCVHSGFGLIRFGEELCGPEYAARYEDLATEAGVEVLLDTMVLDVSAEHQVTCVGPACGLITLTAGAIVLAMGCRERPAGALPMVGYRPAGVFTAGTAQHLVNIEGVLPGREVVILGSGDIGLIMARRMTLEGAHVACVAELMDHPGGLRRNVVQCLDDFGIPLLLSHTVARVHGRKRMEAVDLVEVDASGRPIPGTEKTWPCDTLLLSVGLLPENELSQRAGVELDKVTRGAVVTESLETSVPGIFACGNVLHVHDLVDHVSHEAALAGKNAAAYAMRRGADMTDVPAAEQNTHLMMAGSNVRYVLPQIVDADRVDEKITFRLRVARALEDATLIVRAGSVEIARRKRPILVPGEMADIAVSAAVLSELEPGIILTIDAEGSAHCG